MTEKVKPKCARHFDAEREPDATQPRTKGCFWCALEIEQSEKVKPKCEKCSGVMEYYGRDGRGHRWVRCISCGQFGEADE